MIRSCYDNSTGGAYFLSQQTGKRKLFIRSKIEIETYKDYLLLAVPNIFLRIEIIVHALTLTVMPHDNSKF